MLLGGLWHGAAWNFVIWGAIHGAMLGIERARGKNSLYRRLPAPLKVLLTFVIVLVSWVFFRAETLSDAARYLATMAGLIAPQAGADLLSGLMYQPFYVGTIILAGIITWSCPQTWDFTKTLTPPRSLAVVTLLWAALAVLFTQAYNPFIYFIF
jgi:alginate O-acetyltransferase complex protein AlgI